MRNNPLLFALLFSVIILAIDVNAYLGVRKLIVRYSARTRRVINVLFWLIPALLISGILLFTIPNLIHPANFLVCFHMISGTFLLFYVPKLIFICFYLLEELYVALRKRFRRTHTGEGTDESNGMVISRAEFLTRTGIILAGIPFLSLAYGIKWGRFNFTVRKQTLHFENLPAAFNGFRIVQISDFHIGSFMNAPHRVEEAVEKINRQDADLLLFTGDFVNNVCDEMEKFIPMLTRLRARTGKYSILGNHDYGDYVPWRSQNDKSENLKKLLILQERCGFKVLLNASQKIESEDASIELIGVENWGLPPFPQYGDLDKALTDVDRDAFKILLSHDPTHWDAQVLYHTDIDLTLSGHTHGAQFGIEIPGWRWSPASIRYKRWGGLYREGNQCLNVNTGIGFIGFPGRVGVPPEISVLELVT